MTSGTGGGPDPDPATVARIRRELAHLRSDADTAPDVAPAVTARIGAALRGAPGGHGEHRPALSRSQRAGLTVGVLAACTAVVLGALTLTREPAPPFPAGPTAAQITVDPAARSVFPLSDQELRDLLTAEPDPGPLADPARLVSCLAGLGYPADTEVLGARQLHVSRDPAIVLLTHPPGPTDRIVAVTVGTGCTADDGALVAETTFRR